MASAAEGGSRSILKRDRDAVDRSVAGFVLALLAFAVFRWVL